MEINRIGTDTQVCDYGAINLPLTLDCGQAFRWRDVGSDSFYGIVRGHETVVSENNGTLIFHNTSAEDVEKIWVDYFDLNTDYGEILDRLGNDKNVGNAIKQCGTVRILNQDPWEALCSFIISACNNIPRIKGIIERLCESFGEKLSSGYTFPSPQTLAELTPEQLACIRAGYRAPYIIDAAKKVSSGEIELDSLRTLTETDAEKMLMRINGVGKKVANCTMLFSLGFANTYPIDRHIARANEKLYPNGLPECFEGNKGLAQQYIFHAQRSLSSSEFGVRSSEFVGGARCPVNTFESKTQKHRPRR